MITKNIMKREQKEQKQILVFFGSPHNNGTTAKILNEFLKSFQEGYRIRIINAYDQKIEPCIACNACAAAEGCSQPDFDEIDALIRAADVIVIAAPVYCLSFPAPLKAIIDRTQRYFGSRFSLGIRKPIEKHKTAALLLTCGSPGLEGAEIMSRQLRMVFSVMNTELKGMAVWTSTDSDSGRQTFEKARKSAQDLALAIQCEL